MAKKNRAYFFTSTAPSGFAGVRFVHGDKPTQQTFQDFSDSVPFFNEPGDRSTDSTQGLVRLATDTEAEAFDSDRNADGFEAVTQPHQLPEVVGSGGISVVPSPKAVTVNGVARTKMLYTVSGAGAGADELVKVTAADTTPGNMQGKLTAGANVTLTVVNPGGNEQYRIDATTSANTWDAWQSSPIILANVGINAGTIAIGTGEFRYFRPGGGKTIFFRLRIPSVQITGTANAFWVDLNAVLFSGVQVAAGSFLGMANSYEGLTALNAEQLAAWAYPSGSGRPARIEFNMPAQPPGVTGNFDPNRYLGDTQIDLIGTFEIL